MAEILPSRVRGAASAAATLVNWGCAFVVTETFATLLRAISPPGTFWLFAAVQALGFGYVLTTLPETKGRTLDEIERYFEGAARASTGSARESATTV